MNHWNAENTSWSRLIIGMRLTSLGNHNRTSCWQWADGTAMDFTDWNPDPSRRYPTTPSKCGVVAMWKDDDRWTVTTCSMDVPLLCKYTPLNPEDSR
uniref:C-type lectin domain-containing protein n=1 Tax=Steinernema glaseri TaxID=37863 RepID=A0A1I7Y2C9_9BILA